MWRYQFAVVKRFDMEIGDNDFFYFQSDLDDIYNTFSQTCMTMDNEKSSDEGLGAIGIPQTLARYKTCFFAVEYHYIHL